MSCCSGCDQLRLLLQHKGIIRHWSEAKERQPTAKVRAVLRQSTSAVAACGKNKQSSKTTPIRSPPKQRMQQQQQQQQQLLLLLQETNKRWVHSQTPWTQESRIRVCSS